MKVINYLTIIMVFALCSSAALGQLRVAENGKVAINLDPKITPLSYLSIGSPGNLKCQLFVQDTGNGDCIMSFRGVRNKNIWRMAGLGMNEKIESAFYVGLHGYSRNKVELHSGRSWGVLGAAGEATPGYNYAVYGNLVGKNRGAAIVGTINNLDINVPGTYAGYFEGDVKVTGTLTTRNLTSSDSRLKKNIQPLGGVSSSKTRSRRASCLSSLSALTPVTYNLKQMYSKSVGDTAQVARPLYDEQSQQFQKTHFGLIAQELQKVYPELVYTEDDGYLSVDYIGLIPILIQSIKELKTEIDVLKSSENSPTNATMTAHNTGAVLLQNTPNPFSRQTEIKYIIPETVHTAYLCIYDMQGKQLKQITIGTRGQGSEIISGAEFAAGIYLYGLIADGKQIDVKRMVLTE